MDIYYKSCLPNSQFFRYFPRINGANICWFFLYIPSEYPLILSAFCQFAFYFGRIFWYLSLLVTYSSDNTTIHKETICVISSNSTLCPTRPNYPFFHLFVVPKKVKELRAKSKQLLIIQHRLHHA